MVTVIAPLAIHRGTAVKNIIVATLGLFALAISQSANCAEILGKVADSQGTPITHVTVGVRDASGKSIRSIMTNEGGVFMFKNLIPGDYRIQLHPLTGGLLGRVVPVHLMATGLTFVWRIYVGRPSIAMAPIAPTVFAPIHSQFLPA